MKWLAAESVTAVDALPAQNRGPVPSATGPVRNAEHDLDTAGSWLVRNMAIGADEKGSAIRCCIPPAGIDYFDLAACGVSARFMVAYTLSRAARESAVRLSSPSSSWFAWLAAASASFSIWSAVKNTALFLLRLPDVISVSPTFSQTNRAVRVAKA
jgi:hypothetical protein